MQRRYTRMPSIYSLQFQPRPLFIPTHYARSRKFHERVSNFGNVFFTWWSERESNYHFKRVIMDPPAKRRADDGSTSNAGLKQLYFFQEIRSSIVKIPIFLWFSRGGGGGPDPNIILSEPSMARRRFTGVPMMPNIECWPGTIVIFQEIRSSIVKNLIFLWFSSGGGGVQTPCTSPLWIRACLLKVNSSWS